MAIRHNNENGIMNIETADQAAEALEPLVDTFPNSGYIAKIIFALVLWERDC